MHGCAAEPGATGFGVGRRHVATCADSFESGESDVKLVAGAGVLGVHARAQEVVAVADSAGDAGNRRTADIRAELGSRAADLHDLLVAALVGPQRGGV